MKIRVLGAFGSEGLGKRPTAFLVNDRILVDAGTVPGAISLEAQFRLEHVLVSHAHLDHIAGLAFLTEVLASSAAERPVTAVSTAPVVETLKTAVFNNILWPDFAEIPDPRRPTLAYRTLVDEAEQRVGDLWVTPIAVSHTVPTVGFVVHDGSTGFIYSGDTGPTETLWKAARGLKGIRAVILECAFPNRLEALADAAKHLTPALIDRELDKVPPDIPVWIYHVKPQFSEEIAAELDRIDNHRIELVAQDKTYTI